MGRSKRRGRAVHGIVLLDKATGCSSNQALQAIKRLYNAQKAGHTGSLDPLATGMLPICLGEATKVSSFLLDSNKSYVTQADGNVIDTTTLGTDITLATVEQILKKFRGQIDQVPPMYSALSMGGKRLYKLARQGIVVDRPARRITIHQLQLLQLTGNTLHLRVRCSKGTYIRTLVEDIGTALGCGAHVATLRRESVDPFNSVSMYTEAHLQNVARAHGTEGLDALLLPLDSALAHMPDLNVNSTQAQAFVQGRRVQMPGIDKIQEPNVTDQRVRVYAAGKLLGLGSCCPEAAGIMIQPSKVFNW